MLVIFIHGPAASGKHTIGKLVAERLGVPLFHNHLTVDLVTSLFEFGSEPFRRLRAEIWLAAFRQCAQAGRSFVFTFHPEATVAPETIDQLVATVAESGGTVRCVELLCSRATVLERLANDSRRQFGKLTDPDLYAAIESAGGFEFEGLRNPDLQVDTEALRPEESAQAIVEKVRQWETGHQ